jgi:hypothetical protein
MAFHWGQVIFVPDVHQAGFAFNGLILWYNMQGYSEGKLFEKLC